MSICTHNWESVMNLYNKMLNIVKKTNKEKKKKTKKKKKDKKLLFIFS